MTKKNLRNKTFYMNEVITFPVKSMLFILHIEYINSSLFYK
jgi:hypothetical protein